MRVESANYKIIEEQPVLELTIHHPQFGHQRAYVWDVNRVHLDHGFVSLHDATEFSWEKALKPITDRECGRCLSATRDPLVLRLANEFWDAINGLNGKAFQEGPVRLDKK